VPLWVALALLVCEPTLSTRPVQAQQIHIDIPVVLKDAKVVFNLDRLPFEGDEPAGLQFLKQMIHYFKRVSTKASVVAVFHGGSGYMLQP